MTQCGSRCRCLTGVKNLVEKGSDPIFGTHQSPLSKKGELAFLYGVCSSILAPYTRLAARLRPSKTRAEDNTCANARVTYTEYSTQGLKHLETNHDKNRIPDFNTRYCSEL